MLNKTNKKISSSDDKVYSNCSASAGSDGGRKLSACARCSLVFYCSKDCQRVHWKASHKQHCVAKADRVPSSQHPEDSDRDAKPSADNMEAKCAICRDLLTGASACTLPCTHVFHSACVAELRKFGVEQACPLCRAFLPPGPEKLFEQATVQYMSVFQMVERGQASWSALPASAQHDLDAAIEGWRAAAKEGILSAQFNLGLLLVQGHGVARSDQEAVLWFRQAADQGLTHAQNILGDMYGKGMGVAQSDTEAVLWRRKAADQGFPEAQYSLALHFSNGRGVAQSDTEAVRWLTKAADQGNDEAQAWLGSHLSSGRGVAQSNVEAVRWWKRAADQGNAEAQNNLGNSFEIGRGVAKNYESAARCYKKVANQGNALAQCTLGYLYVKGIGVEQDYLKAAHWWQKAADQEVSEAEVHGSPISRWPWCATKLSGGSAPLSKGS